MQRALVRYPNDIYTEYFFTDMTANTHFTTKELLDNTEYPPDLINLLCDNYSSWVLVVGELGHAGFLGYAIESSVVAYGNYDTIYDWVWDISQGILAPTALDHEPVMFGDLLEARSMKQSLSFLQDLGVIPQLSQFPLNGGLTPILSPEGAKYWMAPVDV